MSSPMNTVHRSRTIAFSALAVIVAAVAAWVLIGPSAPHTKIPREVHREPPAAAAPGTPCIRARKMAPRGFSTLSRAFPLVEPAATAQLGDLETVWTCDETTGVFLQYASGVLILEDDGGPFARDPGGAAGHFRATADDGDGTVTEIGGFPGLVSTPGGGHETTHGVVQFVGNGLYVVVRNETSDTASVESLTTIAEHVAAQLAEGVGVTKPAAEPN